MVWMSTRYLDPIHRLAIAQAHRWTCIICRRPIVGEFDIDHMIPEELGKIDRLDELRNLCARLSRPEFDIYGLQNLGPAHKSCNNEKGTTVFADTVLDMRLSLIESRVQDVERRVKNMRKSRNLEKAILSILAAVSTGELSVEQIAERLKTSSTVAPPPIFNSAAAWTPASLESIKAQGTSVKRIEEALMAAVRHRDLKLQRDLARPNGWVIRFNIDRKPWRAFAILDDGLLLITGVLAKRHRH